MFTDQSFFNHVAYKIPNSFMTGKISKMTAREFFFLKNDSYRDLTWCYYLKGYKYEVIILTTSIKLYDTKEFELPTDPRSQAKEVEKIFVKIKVPKFFIVYNPC